jgi:hypothetical protein
VGSAGSCGLGDLPRGRSRCHCAPPLMPPRPRRSPAVGPSSRALPCRASPETGEDGPNTGLARAVPSLSSSRSSSSPWAPQQPQRRADRHAIGREARRDRTGTGPRPGRAQSVRRTIDEGRARSPVAPPRLPRAVGGAGQGVGRWAGPVPSERRASSLAPGSSRSPVRVRAMWRVSPAIRWRWPTSSISRS